MTNEETRLGPSPIGAPELSMLAAVVMAPVLTAEVIASTLKEKRLKTLTAPASPGTIHLDSITQTQTDTMSKTRKQRTPEQLIAETTARLEKLRVRQAKTSAKDDPALAPIFDELEATNKIIREAKKGLGKGPQSFQSRLDKHNAWIEKIEAEQADATFDLEFAQDKKAKIETRLAEAILNSSPTSSPASLTTEN